MPGAQPVEEVAEVIVELIRRPRPEVYTRPGMQQTVVGYFGSEEMGGD